MANINVVPSTQAENTESESSHTLVIERHFNAPKERVFQAWTEVEHLRAWWGPKGVSIPALEADVREGGQWSATMRGTDNGEEYHHSGHYLTIKPHDELAFTWAWIEDGKRGHETVVRLTFSQQGEQTVMTMEQKLFATAKQTLMHNEGWSSSFDKLQERFA